jgi:hypothetical protein
MQDEISSKPLTALYYTVHIPIVYAATRWLTKTKHVADDKLLIIMCLKGLFIYTFINSLQNSVQLLYDTHAITLRLFQH